MYIEKNIFRMELGSEKREWLMESWKKIDRKKTTVFHDSYRLKA